MTDIEEERRARIEAELAMDALADALKPFALIADREDLKAAIVSSLTADEDIFTLPGWFERVCERARYVMYAKAPEKMKTVASETIHMN